MYFSRFTTKEVMLLLEKVYPILLDNSLEFELLDGSSLILNQARDIFNRPVENSITVEICVGKRKLIITYFTIRNSLLYGRGKICDIRVSYIRDNCNLYVDDIEELLKEHLSNSKILKDYYNECQ